MAIILHYAAKTGYSFGFGKKCCATIKSGNWGFTICCIILVETYQLLFPFQIKSTTPFVLGSWGITCKIPLLVKKRGSSFYCLDLCRNPAGWPDAVGQDDGRRGRQLQHLLQRDGGGEARPQGRLCRPRAHRHWRGKDESFFFDKKSRKEVTKQ